MGSSKTGRRTRRQFTEEFRAGAVRPVLVRFGEMNVETRGEEHAFDVHVHLDDLDPGSVRVELYADGVNGGSPVRQEMKCVRQLAGGAPGGDVYDAVCLQSALQGATRRE